MDDNVRESYRMAVRKDLKKAVNIKSSSTVLSVSLHEVDQCKPYCERFLYVKMQASRYEMQHRKRKFDYNTPSTLKFLIWSKCIRSTLPAALCSSIS